MKYWFSLLFCSVLFFTACKNRTNEYIAAENGLDAGREFIASCNQGDFSKAGFYMIQDPSNIGLLADAEKNYRALDKEGRQLLRQASINIKSVTEPSDSTVLLAYGISGDTNTKTLWMIKQNGNWLVDFKKTFK